MSNIQQPNICNKLTQSSQWLHVKVLPMCVSMREWLCELSSHLRFSSLLPLFPLSPSFATLSSSSRIVLIIVLYTRDWTEGPREGKCWLHCLFKDAQMLVWFQWVRLTWAVLAGPRLHGESMFSYEVWLLMRRQHKREIHCHNRPRFLLGHKSDFSGHFCSWRAEALKILYIKM